MKITYYFDILSCHSEDVELEDITEEDWNDLTEEEQQEIIEEHKEEAERLASLFCDYDFTLSNDCLPEVSFD